jgi:hypothetical protein
MEIKMKNNQLAAQGIVNYLNGTSSKAARKNAALQKIWELLEQINGDVDLYSPKMDEALGKAYDILEAS